MYGTMTTERRFKAIRIEVMRSDEFCALTPLMMYGNVYIDDVTRTAQTDGVNEWYGRHWIETHTDKNVAFGMVHENVHKAGRHLVTYKTLWEIDPDLAAQAMDYWNNLSILRADPKNRVVEPPRLPDGRLNILLNHDYEGWSIKRIFYKLLDEKRQKQQEQQSQPQPDQDGDQGSGQASESSPTQADANDPTQAGTFDAHDWEGAQRMQADEKEAKRIADDIEQAIRQGQHAARQQQAGSSAGKDALGLNELVAPQVRWEDELQAFCTSNCRKKKRSTYNRLNRRLMGQNILLPSRKGEGISELVYGRDASGSMNYRNRLERATTEVVSLATLINVDKIHFIDWDGKVGQHKIYSSEEIADADMTMNPIGGGGTDASCLADYLREEGIEPDCVIVATDGILNNWGLWSVPLLWVICNTDPIVAPVGKSIHVEDE